MSAVLSFQVKDSQPMQRGGTVTTPQLVEAAQDVLLQGLGLLFGLGDLIYSRAVRAPFDASIGQHYRHMLEHFQCLIVGARPGEINYDARQRNPRIEGEVTYASVATCDVLRAIKRWTDENLQAPCKVVSSVKYGDAVPGKVDSNFARELSYCVAHAIHHFAIIRLICAEIGVEVPPEFGYAPSTVKHMSSLTTD